ARTEAVAEPLERLPQQGGARVAEAEDAVAEPHQPPPGGELALGPGGDIAAHRGLIEHVEGWSRRAAMQRPREGAIGAERRRDQRRATRRDDPGGESRGVEAILEHDREI